MTRNYSWVAAALMLLGLALSIPGARAQGGAGVISDFRIEQSIVKKDFQFEARPGIRISFVLRTAADVTVAIGRHLASTQQNQSEYLGEPIPVRTLRLGRRPQGRQEIVWDGLNDQGRPVTETQIVPLDGRAGRPRPQSLTRQVLVDLYRISVTAGGDTVAGNFRRADGGIDASRAISGFSGGVRDPQNALIVADPVEGRARRLNASWQTDAYFPKLPLGPGADPTGAYDVAVDSKGNVYVMSPAGLYRYAPTGEPQAWTDNGVHLITPFPGEDRNVLGVRLDEAAPGPKTYTFGPGPDGVKIVIDAEEALKHPGYAFDWGGVAIDAEDQLYVGRVKPNPEIQVYALSGKYLRTIKLPLGVTPQTLRFGKDGALWVAGTGPVVRLNRNTGELERATEVYGKRLHVAPDGTLYVWGAGPIYRLTPSGGILPFTAKSPQVRDGGRSLDLRPSVNNVPDDAVGFANAVVGLAGGVRGDLFVSVSPVDDPTFPTRRMLHFGSDGTFLPDTLSVSLGQSQAGNVFVEAQPGMFELMANNLSERDQTLTTDWTLTNLEGRVYRGSGTVTARGLTRQRLPIPVSGTEMGHFRVRVTVRSADELLDAMDTQMARIRARRTVRDANSPFGMVWGTNFYLMGLAGVKMERVGGAYWGKIEPVSGVVMPDPPDAMQWPQSIDGFRRYAAKNSVSVPESFSYGEPWLGGGFPNPRIYSYDRFLQYALRVVDRFAGKDVPYYQFWSEPNTFWRVPGPFNREHLALVQQHLWSMVKARDKNALAIVDGDSGTPALMNELATFGAQRFQDAAVIHYPSAKPIKAGNTDLPDTPEGRAETARELVELRDKYYPGRPIWNLEDGWWNVKERTADTAATALPKVYVSQIAAGVDRLHWFAQSSPDDTSYLLDADSAPNPTYCAYATMTRLLERCEYAGPVDFGPLTQGHLFYRDQQAIVVAWATQGLREATVEAGLDVLGGYDYVDRPIEVRGSGGKVTLKLTDHPIYLVMNRNAWNMGVAKNDLQRRLKDLTLDAPTAIAAQIDAASNTAASDPEAMKRLHHLMLAGKQLVLTGDAPQVEGGTGDRVAAARRSVETREGPDGYLRESRIVLDWAERWYVTATRQTGSLSGGYAWLAQQCAGAAQKMSARETVVFPGVVINAFLEPKEIRGGDAAEPIDEKFEFEIDRQPGATFDLELTVWNYTRRRITGNVEARLPEGWTAPGGPRAYAVDPGKFQRFTVTVTVAEKTEAGVYPVGGKTTFAGQPIQEIHAQRIKVGSGS